LLNKQNQKPFPVCGLVGGTKKDPIPVMEGNGFAIQEDNVTLEFNTPPASTPQEFGDSIRKMLLYLFDLMEKKDCIINPSSSAIFSKELLEKHEKAYEFGCEPDFNVWFRSVNQKPEFCPFVIGKEKGIGEYRVAGFHIHTSYLVDYEPPTLEDVEIFVKAQDLFLGVPSVLLDIDRMRRHYYGRAGAFRLKEYGHEYRVLGSGLLGLTNVGEWVFQQTSRIIEFLNNNENAKQLIHFHGSHIVSAINAPDESMARDLVKIFGIIMP
jgi:hypothetical protein